MSGGFAFIDTRKDGSGGPASGLLQMGDDMKWIYGKQDFKTLERGQENCYLMTNGLGGFSSMTMTGSVTRNDHAFLMACTQAPNHRYNMVHRLKERLFTGEPEEERAYLLSSQEFADGTREEGFRYLTSFTYEDTPVWNFLVNGVEIHKEAGMAQGANRAALSYHINNRSGSPCRLEITPFFQFVPKGSNMEKTQELHRMGTRLESAGLSLFFRTNACITAVYEEECYYYSYDACDGRRETGRALANHVLTLDVAAGETGMLEIIYEMEPGTQSAQEIIGGLKAYRKTLEEKCGLKSGIARFLAKSADQFISARESTGGKTILAGFPFFEDWGRDTMIALPGVCIFTGQYETARQILRTFAVNERDGLMPNLFPEGGKAPMYNTADAALLFINCVYLYYEASDDSGFVREMYPVMERIMDGYKNGTGFGIHMDEDGLIQAGEGLDQVTWMDVRAGDILPTPRHGKPVEINAYWYNALRIMERFCGLLHREDPGYGTLADKVRTVFCDKFWLEEKGCLKDLVSGTPADEQIRCNQIWAVSLPFTMLHRDQERRVVETVFEKLYTPYGLRTLDMEDAQFHPYYGGPVLERDMAYHQGTVWAFPLGAYYLAYLKVNDFDVKAAETVRSQLEVLESAMREGCIGQLPEIYDGQNPVSSRGCFAQAWSVGELLRVYETLERLQDGEH